MPAKQAPQRLAETDSALDYGASQLGKRAGELIRAVDGAKLRIQYSDAQNLGRKRVKVMTQNIIDRYFADKALSWRQWKAAEKIRALHRKCRFDSVKISNLLGAGGGKGQLEHMTETAAYARRDYASLMNEIGNIGERVLFWIVISNYSARDYAHRMGLMRDDGMGVLRVTLTALADSYGLP